MMKWSHLPMGGGLYDQTPEFIEDMQTIASIDNRVQAHKAKQAERKSRPRKGMR